jgi:hypothetical protein
MKTAIALFCLVLGLTVQASKLSEIDQSPFGHNLISTVYLQIKTGDSADQVLELLQEVEDEVIREQQDHDARHDAFQTSCHEDQTHYQEEIDRAAADEQTHRDLLAVAYPERTRLEGEIAEHEDALEQAEFALQAARDLIASQREEFHIHSEELLYALEVFGSSKRVLSEAFQRGVSFLQTSSGASFAAKLKDSKLNGKFEPFARILAQAASSNKLSQAAIDNILTLIDRLVANAHATLSTERDVMQQREDAFAIYESELEATIRNEKDTLSVLRTQLSIVESNIAEWEANLADAIWRFETYTRKLAERIAECDEESRQYEEATANRNHDLDIINQVEDLIRTRVADFTEYISATREDIEIH